jgi:hypothetical protein
MWLGINVAFILSMSAVGLVFPRSGADFGLTWTKVILFGPLMVLSVTVLVAVLVRTRRTGSRLPRPSFNACVLDRVQVLTVFLLVGCALCGAGCVGLVAAAVAGDGAYVNPAYSVAGGLGTLIGLGLSLKLFSQEITSNLTTP